MEENIKEESEAEIKAKIEKDNRRTMRNVLLILGAFVLFFALWMIISYNQARFDYEGVVFEKVNEIAPYRTSIPIDYQNPITGNAIEERDYYFYLRNDPRKLDYIPFDGNIEFKDNMVVNSTEDFNCGGRGVIGVANLAKLYQVLGANVIKDESANCDPDGRYIFLQLEKGNESKIEQVGPACYTLYISNCEVLEVTEKFMIETFTKIDEII